MLVWPDPDFRHGTRPPCLEAGVALQEESDLSETAYISAFRTALTPYITSYVPSVSTLAGHLMWTEERFMRRRSKARSSVEILDDQRLVFRRCVVFSKLTSRFAEWACSITSCRHGPIFETLCDSHHNLRCSPIQYQRIFIDRGNSTTPISRHYCSRTDLTTSWRQPACKGSLRSRIGSTLYSQNHQDR